MSQCLLCTESERKTGSCCDSCRSYTATPPSYSPTASRLTCSWWNSAVMTEDVVCRTYSGYEGFFMVNTHTAPAAVCFMNSTASQTHIRTWRRLHSLASPATRPTYGSPW